MFPILNWKIIAERAYSTLYYIPNIDLIEVVFNGATEIGKNEVIDLVNTSLSFNNGTNKRALITATKLFINMSPEARAQFSKMLRPAFKTEKMAIYVNNMGYKLIANFFISVNKPSIPTKMFSNRDKAIEWLLME